MYILHYIARSTEDQLGVAQLEKTRPYTRSRVQVGRGSDDKGLPRHLDRSSNAKTACSAEKVNGDGRTDGGTDGLTDGPT